MLERKKSHLIYLDNTSYVWMQEHGIGAPHPPTAQFFCEVPSNDSSKWIEGKPNVTNVQFLTLAPFYPSQRLDVSVEINTEPKVMKNVNHPAFEGCVKYMPVHLLDFRSLPVHIARTIHTIGVCHYGKQDPYKTVDVDADNKITALEKGKNLLNPSTVEHLRHFGCKPNPEYDTHYNKKPKM